MSESGSVQLQADAPVFVPGQVSASQNQARIPLRQRKRRMSKSTAADLPTRIHEDIDNGNYECMICSNEIYRNSKIWDCSDCWSVFHISCIKKWASSEGSAIQQRREEDGSLPPPRQWRCPGCNLPKDEKPNNLMFTCWCTKEVDPKSLPGLPPFSCGQTCARDHILPKDCPHPCHLSCHAGPCPPCPQMGPTQSCFCGRESHTRKCVDTDYKNGWSCGQVCGEMMPCGEHFCDRPCHEGLCGACEVRVEARCYCGQVEKNILCCDREDEKKSRRTYKTEAGEEIKEEWTAVFHCANTCGRLFDCGVHACEKACHVQDEATSHCPRSPDIITHCPCGKTPLADLTERVRTSCTDKIQPCKRACEKELPCGHKCEKICHIGDCPPCLLKMSINCRCGRTSVRTICHQGDIEPPECMRTCKATLNCGRHECGEHCCTGEKKAADRQKRKPRALNAGPAPNDFEAEHICTRICGRLLKCKNHTCPELCHRGPCKSCREAVFDEIACNCGRTVLQPPLPCGTLPPPCTFPCERERDCGHAQVPHNCHQDAEQCPPCPYLTTKRCLCGKDELKNQPCSSKNVRCGKICGRRLKCGYHHCRKTCHKPGECEDAGQSCQQNCGKEKTCSHPCEYKCHVPSICKEDKPCQHKIFITCDCQRIKQEIKCGATRSAPGNASKSLKCDDECARLERNRRLALALNVDPETRQDDHIPYAAETLNMYLETPAWCQTQEKVLRAFAADPDQKRKRFEPMKTRQRAFIHSLAEDFGFDTESADPEPHRHVAVFKTPRFVMAPMKTLGECARIRQIQRQVQLGSATRSTATIVSKEAPKLSNVVGEPFNAWLISNARFGLTIEDLRAAITPALSTSPTLKDGVEISFLPSEDIVLHPSPSHPFATPKTLEDHLTFLKEPLARALAGPPYLGRVQLARVDDSLNILRRESDDAKSSGWSQVAKAAAAPRRAPVESGVKVSRNNFAVFETAAARAAKKKKVPKIEREPTVDDWETAELEDEERERRAASGDEGGDGEVAEVDGGNADVAKVDEQVSVPADGGRCANQ